MANLYEKASLVLPTSPAYKDGAIQAYKPLTSQGTFDFSRGSNLAATRVNANGLIEKGRENLLLQSNSFSSSSWDKNATSLTSGQLGYDNSNDAWLLTKSASGSNIAQNVSASGITSISIYVKANSSNWVTIQALGGINPLSNFDIANGELGYSSGVADTKIESVGNGYYRCTMVVNVSLTTIIVYPANGDNDRTATSGSIYIQDAQLEQGLVATDYIETGADTAQAGILEDLPRLDYSGDASCPSLLLEPQRTNLIPYSEYFGASNWVKLGVGTGSTPVITHNYATSPEGLQNATRIQLNLNGGTSSGDQSLFYDDLGTKTGDHTRSVYIKSNSGEADLYFGGTLNDKKIITATNEWQRFDFKSTLSAESLYVTIGLRGTTGSSNNADILVWGFQAEEGSYPTSYIPTYGSAVTRSQDVPTNLSASDLIGSDEGVMFLDLQTPFAIEVDMNFSISDGTGSNYARIEIRQDLSIDIRYRIGGSNQISARVGSFAAGDRLKIAFAYKSGDSALYMNGSQLTTTSGTISSNSFNEIRYSFPTGIVGIEGNVKETFLFKRRLSNAELAALTTI